MSGGPTPIRPTPRLLVDPPKHVARNYRSWLFYGAAHVALAPGMMTAELRRREKDAADWIAAHPEQARELSKQVEAGRYGDLRD